MTISTLTGMLETADRLQQLRVQAFEAEQELLEYTRRAIQSEQGQDAEKYLWSKVVEVLHGHPEGTVRQRTLLSALENAYSAGVFRARGGKPGPAPVQHPAGTPPWLYHLGIDLEDALARFPRTFSDEETSQLRGAALALRDLATRKTRGKDGHGAG